MSEDRLRAEMSSRQASVDATVAFLGREPTVDEALDYYQVGSNRRRIKEINHLLTTVPCPTCDGTGRVPREEPDDAADLLERPRVEGGE